MAEVERGGAETGSIGRSMAEADRCGMGADVSTGGGLTSAPLLDRCVIGADTGAEGCCHGALAVGAGSAGRFRTELAIDIPAVTPHAAAWKALRPTPAIPAPVLVAKPDKSDTPAGNGASVGNGPSGLEETVNPKPKSNAPLLSIGREGKNGLVGEGVRGDGDDPVCGDRRSTGDEWPDPTSGNMRLPDPGDDLTEEGPAKAGRGGARSSEEGPRQDPADDAALGVGMAICEGRGMDRFWVDREAGRQICSPSDERGIESEHEVHLTLGKATDARSIPPKLRVNVDMMRPVEVDNELEELERQSFVVEGWFETEMSRKKGVILLSHEQETEEARGVRV